MLDYKSYIIKIITQGDYILSDMEERIDKLWLDGKLSQEDRDELMPMAAQYAKDIYQINIANKFAELEHRIYELEHPTDIYAIGTPGYQTQRHEIVRFDITGDDEYDLCRYDGGREYTSLSIGKIEGWVMVDREGNATHNITRDASGGYVVTPIAVEPQDVEDEPIEEPQNIENQTEEPQDSTIDNENIGG